jgi:cyclase
MLKPRIIPCLLIRDNGLVKTVNFSNEKYVGDPINAVKIFNEKLVDELMIIDIDATVKNQDPNFDLIKKIAAESQMPISYTGGIKNVEQVKKIIGYGVEKVGISSSAILNPDLISHASNEVGSQSVVVILDVKRKLLGGYQVYTHNGTKDTSYKLKNLVENLSNRGAGELIINSIDNDGIMGGYDINIIKSIKDNVSIPITLIGGAGSIEHIKQLVDEFHIVGAAAGSMFVFQGKYKAVLISYPNQKDKNYIFDSVIKYK